MPLFRNSKPRHRSTTAGAPRRRLGGRLSAPEQLEERRFLDASGYIAFANGSGSALLYYEATSIAGGLTHYDVFLDDPSGGTRSYFLDALTFTGIIQQDGAGGSNTFRVDDDLDASNFDGFNYDRATDSYFFRPFSANTITPAITDTGNAEGLTQRSYAITGGSGPDSQLDQVRIAQIIANGDVTISGVVSRGGQNLFIPADGNRVMRSIADTSTSETIGSAIVALGAQRLLGHGLNPSEVAAFEAQIQAGATRGQLADALWDLPENLGVRVTGLFQTILHRAPTQAERDAQVAVLAGGGTEKQVAKNLLNSTEYNQAHASNVQFVDGLYSDLLGRPADVGGRQSWVNALATLSRSQVIDAFLASGEYNVRVANQLSVQLLLSPGGATVGSGDGETIGKAILSSDPFARQALSAALSASNSALSDVVANRLSRHNANLNELARSVLAQQTGTPRPAIVAAAWYADDHLARQIDSLYRAILRRPADPVGTAYFRPLLAAGAGVDSVVMALLTSAEYQSTHASSAAFIDGLYVDLLGRPADVAGRNVWVAALASGTTRTEAAQAFLNSTERRMLVIQAIYFDVLQRTADPGGLQAYLALWQQGSSPDAIARTLLASDEFFSRFAL